MQFLLFAVLLLAIIAGLAFVKPLEVQLVFDSECMDMHVSFTWLSFLAVRAEMIRSQMHASFFLFKRKMKSIILKKKRKISTASLKAVSIEQIGSNISYGFNEPYMTGLLYGTINSLGALLGIKDLEQYAEFLPEDEYLRISATAKINIGKTITNLLKQKAAVPQRRKKMDNANLNENVDYLFRSLENFTQNEGIIGKPVIQGDKTFLPVVSITVGYGGGNANIGKSQQDTTGMMKGMAAGGTGTGALGLGAKLCTDAVIVIDNQNVSLLSMSSNTGTLMDKIPQIISGMGQNKQAGQTAQG